MTNAISMVGLTKRYRDVQALTDLTLDVPAGTVFGFLGPNGAGKTTALKVLAGLASATAGSATVNGVPVSAAGEHRRQLGYLAQEPRFYGWMTGRETLRYVAQLPWRTTGRGRRGSTRCSSASASPTPPIDGRRPIRAACASGWASPRRSSGGPP